MKSSPRVSARSSTSSIGHPLAYTDPHPEGPAASGPPKNGNICLQRFSFFVVGFAVMFPYNMHLNLIPTASETFDDSNWNYVESGGGSGCCYYPIL